MATEQVIQYCLKHGPWALIAFVLLGGFYRLVSGILKLFPDAKSWFLSNIEHQKKSSANLEKGLAECKSAIEVGDARSAVQMESLKDIMVVVQDSSLQRDNDLQRQIMEMKARDTR